jgi:crotonobetainyl-CoA:carnitine CoA-transferase CaiB-like acyl-CoA transferase
MIRDCLQGLSVLDFTQIGAGPTCTMMLADFGADVIKVEPPAGDVGRQLGPPWYGAHSAVFVAFNRGKRSIGLDLKQQAGRDVARRLALQADILVESFRPGVMDGLGLGYAALSAESPKLVYCAVSGFGQTGPKAHEAGVDGILQAASGLMGLIGDEVAGPCKVQAPIVDVSTGYIATTAVLAAVVERTRTGRGGFLDVSLLATAVALQTSALTGYLGDGKQPARIGSAAPYSAPNEAFQAADGWVMVAAYIGDRWNRLCQLLGLPEMVEDARFNTSSNRVHNRPAMRAALAPSFARRTCGELIAQLKAADIPCSKVADYPDLMEDSQVAHLGMVVALDHAGDGQFRTVGQPINAREANAVSFAPPPRAGEHAWSVLEGAGYAAEEIEMLLASGAVRAG